MVVATYSYLPQDMQVLHGFYEGANSISIDNKVTFIEKQQVILSTTNILKNIYIWIKTTV